MKYLNIRDKIKTGDLLAWSEGGSWTSWRNIQLNLVRMGTMSDYNHVGIAYVVADRVFVVEAVVPYTRIFPLSRLLPFYYIETPFKASSLTEERMLQYVGTPYSKWEAIKAPFTKGTNNKNVLQCAKLVNEIFAEFDDQYRYINDTPTATVNRTVYNHEAPVILVT